jgi:hypothetical protein
MADGRQLNAWSVGRQDETLTDDTTVTSSIAYRAIVVLAACGVLAIAAVALLEHLPPFDAVASTQEAVVAELQARIRATRLIATPLAVGYTTLYGAIGIRALRTGAWPPPGIPWPAAVRRRRGAPARVRGALCVAVAGFVTALYLAFFSFQ